MKKVLFYILLMFFTTTNVFSLEKDNTVILKQKTKIVILSDNMYAIENNLDVFTLFGKTPSEHYFYNLLKNNYSFKFNNQERNYKVEHEIIDTNSSTDIGSIIGDDGLMLTFGNTKKLLNEKEIINIKYESTFNKNQNNIYSYSIVDNNYDTNKVTFEIIFPFELSNDNIYFSTNGKNFDSNIEGLKYDIVENTVIKGSYSKNINKDQILSFLVVEEENIINKNNNYLILYGIISILIIVIIIFIVKKRKAKFDILQ